MIYLLNNKEELQYIIPESDLIEFTETIKINAFDESSFELVVTKKNVDLIKNSLYFGYFNNNDFRLMKLIEFTVGDVITVKGIDKAEYDLRTSKIIEDRRLTGVSASSILNTILDNTGFNAGVVEGITATANNFNMYYITPIEALVKLVETFNCEFKVEYTFVANKVSSRKIHLYKRQGKYTGKQFYHGSDLLKIKYEENNDSIVTALIGRGKGEQVGDGYGRRIQFSDVVWATSKGDPLNKPAGQNWIALDSVKNTHGIYDFRTNSFNHRWAVYVNENIDDPNLLLEATYQQLITLSKTLTVYEADVLSIGEDVRIGDRIAIIRDDIDVVFEARIFELIIDKLDSGKSIVKLGDYEQLKNPTSSLINSRINDAMDQLSNTSADYFNEQVERQKQIFKEEFDEKERLFKLEMDNKFIEAETKIIEKNEVLRQQINSKIEAEATKNQELMDEFKQSFDSEKQELLTNINSVSTDVNSKLESTNRKIEENRTEATRLTNEVREEANNLGRNINELRTNIEQSNRGLREDVTRINQKFDSSGNLVELGRYKVEREATERDMTTKITELQLYKDGEAERTAVIENKIIESARGTEQKLSETYSNLGLNYFKNTKTFGGDWYQKSSWTLESETNNGFAVMSRTSSWQGISQSVYSEDEQWWTVSFDLRGEDLTRVVVYTTHGSDSATITSAPSRTLIINSEFARYSHTFKVGTAGFIRPRVERAVNIGKLYVSKMKLEKGRVSTAWVPHVDDNETYTSDRLVTINNSLDGIRTTISGVDRRVNDVNSNLNTYKSEREQTDRATREQLTALNSYMSADGTRQTNILSLAERKTAELLSREMTNVSNNYVANSVFTETVNGINRKFSETKLSGRNLLLNSTFFRDFKDVGSGNGELYDESKGQYSWAIDSVEKFRGFNTLRIVSNYNGTFSNQKLGLRIYGDGIRNDNQFLKNKDLTISFWAKASINNFILGNRAGERGEWQGARVSLTTEWKYYSFRLIKSADYPVWNDWIMHLLSVGIVWIALPKIEYGTEATAHTNAPEDNLFNIDSKIAEYRQTVEGQIATVRGIADNGVRLASSIRQEIDNINLSVSSLNRDTIKYADVDISDRGIRFGSRAEIDGRTIGSILSLSPDGIRAVTDKMVITAENENLVSLDKRKLVISNARDVIVSQWFNGGLKDGDEFLVQCQCLKKVARAKQSFNILLYVDFQDGTARKFPIKQLQGEIFDTMFSLGGGGVNTIPFIVNMTFKPTWGDAFNLKPVERWCIVLRQETQSNFCEWEVRNLAIYKKKSAELIVDGSITAKHLNTDSVRTGILTANSINSTMLSSDVILAKHLKVDNAMIDKLMLNDLLVSKIIAKQAFINKVKAIDIDASRITSGVLQATNGNVYINLDTGYTRYKESASIRFMSAQNNIHYQNGTSKAFVNFTDATNGGASAAIGVNSDGEVNTNTGSFAGVKVFRNTGKQGGQFLDQVDLVGDTIHITGGTDENNGILIKTTYFSEQLNLYQFLKMCNDNFKKIQGCSFYTSCFN